MGRGRLILPITKMEINNQDLKKQILKKNNNVFIEFNVSGKNYKVPYYPFTIWLYSRIFNYFNKIKVLKGIYGEPVSKPNIKMKKDCPYHTDWLICAGIKVEDFYLNGTYNNWDIVIEDYIKENGEFTPKKIEAKRVSGDKYEILSGLTLDEEVINNALFLYDADAMTNRLYDETSNEEW
jgi:hypothetical protein